ALPENRDLVAARVEMTIDAVVAGVELAVFEPLDVGAVEVVLAHLVPRLVPSDELLGLLGPERLGVFDRAPVHFLVLRIVDERMPGRRLGDGIDFFFGHTASLRAWVGFRSRGGATRARPRPDCSNSGSDPR